MQREESIRKGFNRIAPFYDLASALFSLNSIYRSQVWFLKQPLKCTNALILGGGTGKLLVNLMQHNLAEHYCYVDISDKMIASTKNKINRKTEPKKRDSVEFICGSYTDIPAGRRFDMIITPYSLDCFSETELPPVLKKLDTHLSKEGTWLFADFNIPTNFIFKLPALLIVRMLSILFNMMCGLNIKRLPDFNKEFAKLGYAIRDEKYFACGILVSRIYKNTATST